MVPTLTPVRLDAATPEAERVALREAARDFEALLFKQFLKSAFQPIGGPSLLDGGPQARIYREQYLEEVARLAARRGSLGLAKLVEADTDSSKETTGEDGR